MKQIDFTWLHGIVAECLCMTKNLLSLLTASHTASLYHAR